MTLTALLARDGFNSADTGDIDGRTADGGDTPAAAVGAYVRHPTTTLTGPIGIRSSHATGLGAGGYAIYTLADVTGLDGAEHAAETLVQFPTLDTPTGTIAGPACSRDGFPVGSGTNPDTTPWYTGGDTYTVWFQRPPNGAVVTLETTLSDGLFLKVFYEVTAAGVLQFYESITYPVGDPREADNHTHRQIGAPGAPAGPIHDACNYVSISVYNDGVQRVKGQINGNAITTGTTATDVGSPTYSASGVTLSPVFPDVTTGGEAFEFATTEVLVRQDPTDRTSYSWELAFSHFEEGSPLGTFRLWAAEAGTYTKLRELADYEIPHDDPRRLRLEVSAANVLTATWGDVTLFVFDLATDLADETGTLAPMIATGLPALSTDVTSGGDDYLAIEEFSVYGAVPCEGGPDNPYPWDPPPVDPEQGIRLWVRKGGAWRPVPASQLSAQAGGSARTATGLTVRARGQWRTVLDPDDDQPPPPNTPYPPFFDPCGLLAPIDPTGTVTPEPLTGRIFGMGGAPVSVCGPIFSGTKIALGPWTVADLAACAAKSCRLNTGQGGYGQYKLGGVWDQPTFVSVTLGKLLPLLSTLQSYTTSGPYEPGHTIIDDFASSALWPRGGLSEAAFLAEIVDALAEIRASAPGINLGVRGRPSQFATDPGFDSYVAQYVAWRRETAYDFALAEYTLAASRGAYIWLDINYVHGGDTSSGFQHFDGTIFSGKYECSPSEVVDYLGQMFQAANDVDGAAHLIGSAGYTYDTTFLARAGMIDAMTTARNLLAALPALP